MMKRSFPLFFAALALLPCFALAKDDLTRVYKMRWVLAHEPIKVFDRAARHFAEEVSRQTGGKVTVEVISSRELNNGNLFTPDEIHRRLTSGEIEMSQTYSTYLGNHNRLFWALDLPFIFRDHDHVARVLEGPVGGELLAGLGKSVEGLAFTYSGGYMIVPTSDREIKTIEDFKGLKVVINNNSPVGSAFMSSLGAIPELFSEDSIKTGGKNSGFETTFARLDELGADVKKSSQVLNETHHRIFLTTILISKKFFLSMPKPYQEGIRKAAAYAARLEREDSIRDGEKARAESLKAGRRLVSMDKDQLTRFKSKAGSIYEKFEPMFGKDFVAKIQKQ